MRNGVVAAASTDERFVLGMLLAPFLIVALSLGGERIARQIIAAAPEIAVTVQSPKPLPLKPIETTPPPLRVSLQKSIPLPSPSPVVPAPRTATSAPASPPAPLPTLSLLIQPPLPELALLVPPRLPALSLLIPPRLPELALLIRPPLPALSLLIRPPLPKLALLVRRPLPVLSPLIARPAKPPVCLARAGLLQRLPARAASVPPHDGVAFGRALSDAARAQLGEFVIYNPKYITIAYPMGDVAPLFGVCTDVVVRAYRALGVDLQVLVQQTKSGTGDRNIDHRRVEVMRRFFARHGTSLPISDFAEDYEPGDIVTYYRPQNRSSTGHIAIVTDRLAPSGRPMIVHNRGWGPQLEDALFVDKITGHYRFTGMEEAPRSRPSARRLTREASNVRERRVQPVR